MADWEIIDSSYVVRDRWLTLRADECRTADGVTVAPYYVFEYPDWVNVLAITREAEIVVIRQYRHGIRRTVLELPGGAVDPGDDGVDAAVRRELLEETGYGIGTLTEIGCIGASPPNHTNRIHCFLARDAEPAGRPHPESTETIRVETMSPAAVLDAAHRGEFEHPHHLATIFFATAFPDVFPTRPVR